MRILLITSLALGVLGAAVPDTTGNYVEADSPLLTKRCCDSVLGGCYAVKGEAYNNADCTDFAKKASIANYADHGACVNIANQASIKSFHDGCTKSHVDLHFFREAGCPGGAKGGFITVRTNGGGKCTLKPDGAVAFIAVAN